MSDGYDYQLKAEAIPGSEWVSVSKEDWIKAERWAGFRPYGNSGYLTTCATSGFSCAGGISGRIVPQPHPADEGSET